ncbi:MAG: alpha/beta hydrolase [Gemmatimonadales bacterium]
MALLSRQGWRRYALPNTGGLGKITLLTAPAGRWPDRRRLLVALPPGEAPRPVLYLQDGQNLFDPATSHAGDWGLVDTLNALAPQGMAPIVVGIPHRGRRRRHDYDPFLQGERYLRLVTGVVKPLIDRSFLTRSDRSHTTIAGSSLGGLISLYGFWRYPGIFGAALVLSPALWVSHRAIFGWLERHRDRPPPPPSRLYLDIGTGEGADAVQDVRALRDWLHTIGWSEGSTLRYVEDPGAPHHESAWGRRLREAIPFLMRR